MVAADAEVTSFVGVTSACESATICESATTSEEATRGVSSSERVRFVRFRFGFPAACSKISLADFAHVPH